MFKLIALSSVDNILYLKNICNFFEHYKCIDRRTSLLFNFSNIFAGSMFCWFESILTRGNTLHYYRASILSKSHPFTGFLFYYVPILLTCNSRLICGMPSHGEVAQSGTQKVMLHKPGMWIKNGDWQKRYIWREMGYDLSEVGFFWIDRLFDVMSHKRCLERWNVDFLQRVLVKISIGYWVKNIHFKFIYCQFWYFFYTFLILVIEPFVGYSS